MKPTIIFIEIAQVFTVERGKSLAPSTWQCVLTSLNLPSFQKKIKYFLSFFNLSLSVFALSIWVERSVIYWYNIKKSIQCFALHF